MVFSPSSSRMMAGSEIPKGSSLMSSQLHMWGKTSPSPFSSTFYKQSRLSIPQLCPGLHTPKICLELSRMET